MAPSQELVLFVLKKINRNDSARDNDSDFSEPDPKRLRLTDGYEIALAVMEFPRMYKQAMASHEAAEWNEAVCPEIRSHFRNHTWDTIHRPDDVRLIGNKWVFDVKRDADGNIVRYKARLIAQGFRQVYGIDYWETYSPISSLNSVRAFLALRCQRGYAIRQLDVETAFLNVLLDENKFMRPPEGIRLPDGMICKLRCRIYGLKQAASMWHKTILSVLKSM
ncbi:hypothetical protein PsorP6_007393 [Peronosclerospora sorghi]|uniref:Uncharacterized protein n=1 Tax=Peronosclerospora sorghi TaxID=230839 RepID=A0ACC0W759_9STRA|nr:hypothetical protein PsorP6_007393 [Peronosclerospora sorghi]